MRYLFQMVSLALILCSLAHAQNCKVLLPALVGSYEGDCQNNKANGKGKAIGTDSYEGVFKNGYPEGEGKYTWKNGSWYEGNFKSGKRNNEGTMHIVSTDKADSIITGFWAKDMYVGLYEAPFKVQSKSFMVTSVLVTPDKQQEPQIVIAISSVMGGSEDLHRTIPKPVLNGIDIKRGSFQTRSDVTNMTKKNIYYLTNVIFPFSAGFRIGQDEVVIDFNHAQCWKVEIIMRE